jgi:ABC-type branched-subunit amino acid transport system substrate-binding protein
MREPVRVATWKRTAAGAATLAVAIGLGAAEADAQDGPIKIGLLAPMTGVLATSGEDMANGFKLSWEKAGYMAGGREVEVIVANTECNPDNALTQARRLALQDQVHVMVGPLCGHEGPAVAQVSKETGVPLVMDPAGADAVTKWDRSPTVVRTAVSSSQIGHQFGDYLYNEAGFPALVVEHHLPLALAVADHIYVIASGQLVFDGTAAELAQNEAVLDAHLGASKGQLT